MKINASRVRIAVAVAAISLLNFGAVMLSNGPRLLASQGENFLDTTGTYSGLQAANRINGALDALLTCNKGSSAPTNALGGAAKAGQCWLDDTSATLLVKKRYSGAAWVVEGVIDVSNGVWVPPIGGGAATVASATTTNLCASPQAVQNVTGTTPIAGFGADCVNGTKKILIFAGATTLTYHATSLIIPAQRDYTTTAGDVIEAVSLGSGNWRITNIAKIDGNAVLSPAFRVGTLYYTFEDVDSKAVLAFGQALSRATYPDYLAAVTRTQSAVRSSGNNTLTSVANTKGLGAGMPIEGTGIQSGTTIASVTASTIVMSQNATSSGTANVMVFKTGYGSGGDSTTVGVPDCQGRKIAGRDDMSGTAAARLPSATVLNTAQGSKEQTLSALQIPQLATTGITASSVTTGPFNQAGNTNVSITTGGAASGTSNVGPIAISTTIGGTINATGGASHPIVDPTLIAECAIRVLP